MRNLAPLLLSPLLLANAEPTEIPAPVRSMLDAAMKAGDEAAVNSIVKYARAASADSAVTVEKIAGDWKKQRREAAERKLREAPFLDLMKGRAELGGYYTTGNIDSIGLTAVLDVKREALRWRHKWRLQADYQESLGQTVREHYLAAYEPNFKIDDRAYVYGAALFESDRFLGFDQRYSLSAGAGYTAVKNPKLRIDLELGPAFRATDLTDDTVERQLAARGKLDLDWTLSRGITISQDASAYLQQANSTVTSKSALRARLFGPLSAQLSYAVQYESMPPAGRATTDTTSRAALLVDF